MSEHETIEQLRAAVLSQVRESVPQVAHLQSRARRRRAARRFASLGAAILVPAVAIAAIVAWTGSSSNSQPAQSTVGASRSTDGATLSSTSSSTPTPTQPDPQVPIAPLDGRLLTAIGVPEGTTLAPMEVRDEDDQLVETVAATLSSQEVVRVSAFAGYDAQDWVNQEVESSSKIRPVSFHRVQRSSEATRDVQVYGFLYGSADGAFVLSWLESEFAAVAITFQSAVDLAVVVDIASGISLYETPPIAVENPLVD